MDNGIQLSPKNDVFFKEIFANTLDSEPLVDFLSVALGYSKTVFKQIELSRTELKRDSAHDRLGIVDIRVKTPDHMDIDVEVQVLRDDAMPERSLFYCANMYSEHIQRGESFDVLRNVRIVNISILGYKHFQDKRVQHTFKLREANQCAALTEGLRIDFLELPKVPEGTQALDDLTAWLIFLNTTAENKEVLEMLENHSEPLKRAVVRFEELTADEEKRREALQTEREILAEKSRTATALREGHEEGRREERHQIARNLLAMALPIEQIAKATGLSEKEIRKLQQ